MESTGTWWLWSGFIVFVLLLLLSIDIKLLGNKKAHSVSFKEAFTWTGIWVSCALIFNLLFWIYLKHNYPPDLANQRALEFFTGYLIEESLSFDNMFIILMIFSFFKVPREYQRKVLLYGVLGAIFLRLLMIASGTWLVNQFHWVLYFFGLFLLFTGIKMLFLKEKKSEFMDNPVVKIAHKFIRFTHEFHGEQFFVVKNFVRYATPLFLVLILIEVSDLIFALDSIPAIFAITNDTFVIFSSNIFAILGLRAIYFVLSGLAERFHLLKYGIALLLIFVGIKMLIEPWFEISIGVDLAIIASILITTITLSFIIPPKTHLK